MKFLPMLELMVEARRGGYTVPAFPCWNTEIASIVLRTAQEMGSPVIYAAERLDHGDTRTGRALHGQWFYLGNAQLFDAPVRRECHCAARDSRSCASLRYPR